MSSVECCGYNDGYLNQQTKLEVVPAERLESWKEIALYLNRSGRTVRRWEEKEGLPVHRLQHDKRGSAYAYRAELDAWRESRRQLMQVDSPQPPAESRRVSRVWWWTAAALLLAAGSAAAYRILRPTPRTPPGFTSNPEAYRAYQKAHFGANAGRTQVQTGIKYY